MCPTVIVGAESGVKHAVRTKVFDIARGLGDVYDSADFEEEGVDHPAIYLGESLELICVMFAKEVFQIA